MVNYKVKWTNIFLVILLCIVNYTHFLIDYNYSYILIVEVEGHAMSRSLAKSTTVMIIDKIGTKGLTVMNYDNLWYVTC